MTTFSDPFADWWPEQDWSSTNSNAWDAGTGAQTGPYADIFKDYLEAEPDIPYQGALARANLTPNQMLTFRNRRQDIFRQFQAQLDEQFRHGIMPTATETDFYRNFDYAKEFQRYAPSQRVGENVGQFAPPMRVFRDGNRR